MGVYLNPGNTLFQNMINSEIYVDHSLLIETTNKIINTENNKICILRPRRFGKSTDANMLVAYYSNGCDSSHIFNNLKISHTELYQKHLNQHNVIHLNMQDFLSKTHDIEKMIQLVNSSLIWELLLEYKDLLYFNKTKLTRVLSDIYSQVQNSFIFIIDEWDCIFREYKNDKEAQKIYLDFLRNLLKDKPYVELAYMIGILPIKKYGTHSALNMFKEISMLNPTPLEEFMGFTEDEVKELCLKYDMNYDGLKDDVVKLLAGESVPIQITSFQNDMTTFKSKDDVLTLLIHLGYLGYNSSNRTCYIPNKEVVDSFVNSIRSSDWNEITKALLNSRELLEATWKKDEEAVAKYIEEAHLDTSMLTYNNENALSYTISIAYIYARNYYTMIREMPTGQGFADIVFIPKDDKPAMIVELKWNRDVQTAITQIKDKNYVFGLEKYKDNLLLICINYDKKTKKHTCMIEEYKY